MATAPARIAESEGPGLPDDRERDVPSQQVVRAVRHIDDPHHPEDEGESSRKKEKERAVGDAVESLRHPEFHGYYFDSRSRTVGPPFATTRPRHLSISSRAAYH